MSDMISRQAAIAVADYTDYVGLSVEDVKKVTDEVVKGLKRLPSAQPEIEERMSETEQNVPNDDFISRKRAIDAIEAVFPVDPMKSEYAQGIACGAALSKTYIEQLPSAQPEQRWIPCSERLPDDNREVEATCEIRRVDGKKYRYTCHASYVHRYSIESTDYCNWEDCDEYNKEEDKYYALSGWYERLHNWEDYSYCAIEDFVIAWRELPEPYGGEQE